jgi:hypothetical protein
VFVLDGFWLENLAALRPRVRFLTISRAMAFAGEGAAGSASPVALFGVATLVYERDHLLTD